MPAPFQKIAVLGAGSWGTALAVWLAARGHAVTLWGHDPAHIRALCASGTNHKYLPGVALPPAVQPVADHAEAAGADLAVILTPSRALREVARRMGRSFPAPRASSTARAHA